VDLSTKDYRNAVKRLADKQLRGGIVYDALHLQAALKKEIPNLVTFNEKDFLRLINDDEIIVHIPN